MLGLLALALLAPAARAGDGEAPHNLRGAAVPRPPARVVAPVFPWPPDGTEPDCRDEAAWASSEGLHCADVARDAAALCRARRGDQPRRRDHRRASSDDGWAAADACACACAEVLVATTLPSRRRLAEAARAPQAIDEDARRPGVDCTDIEPDNEPGSGTYEAGCADALSVADLKGAYYPRADARTGGATVDVTLLRNGTVNDEYDPYGVQGFAGLPWAGITYGGNDGSHVYCADAACVADHLEAEGSTPVAGARVIHLVQDLVLPELRLIDVRDKTLEGHGHRLKFVRGTRKSLFVLHACRNLVFRGLYLEHDGANSPGADVFFVSDSHHVVWDACTFDYGRCDSDTCDESIHMAAPSTFLTVQRSKFIGYVQSMNIKHGSMLGNKGDDQNSLHVTFYECYFYDGHSREPKVDAGKVHLVNCVWYNSNGYSYYGVRALSTTTELGTARPEVLVEAAYVEAIDRIYRMEGLDDDVGVIAEAYCNLDDHSRSKTDEPFFVSDLTWCVPYAYYRMDAFDCGHVTRVMEGAGAGAVGPSSMPSSRPTYAPSTMTPTHAPSPACADDPTWSYGTKASNTCAYVAQKIKRCKAKNTDGIRSALEACPATCGTCPTWGPTEAPTLRLYPPTPHPTLSTTVRPPEPTPSPSTPEPTPGPSRQSTSPTRGPAPGPSRQPTPSTPVPTPGPSRQLTPPTPGPASGSCVDDATWCYGSCSPNDCAYVAQKLKRCKAKNTDGVRTALEACPATCGTCSAPAPTPTSEPSRRPVPEATPGPAPRAPSPTPHPTPAPYHPTPTYAPSPRCADDPTWSYGTKASNTCAYVARKLKRCKAKNTDGFRNALEACPVTCGTC